MTIVQYINATPHAINVAGVIYPKTELLARVAEEYTDIVDGECTAIYGQVEGLPEMQEGTKYIVSAQVLAASDRADLVAPATGHKDVVRNERGHIVSVPCFRRNP